jgi:hypothetical protein
MRSHPPRQDTFCRPIKHRFPLWTCPDHSIPSCEEGPWSRWLTAGAVASPCSLQCHAVCVLNGASLKLGSWDRSVRMGQMLILSYNIWGLHEGQNSYLGLWIVTPCSVVGGYERLKGKHAWVLYFHWYWHSCIDERVAGGKLQFIIRIRTLCIANGKILWGSLYPVLHPSYFWSV